jgi:chromosome segregation ATPase
VSDVVKAEVRAVRQLKQSITSGTEQLREAVRKARREMAATKTRTQDAVDQRRSHVARAQKELQRAREELTRAPEQARDGRHQAVIAAQQRLSQAQQQLDQARRADKLTASASSDLLAVLQVVDAAVAEQSSAASSILASLDGKLTELTGGGFGAFLGRVGTTVAVVAEVATATVDVAKLAGNVSQGRIPTADQVTSTSQLAELRTEQAHQLYQDAQDIERERRRRRSDGRAET